MKTIDELLYEWLVENDVPSGVSRWDDGQWHYIDVDLYGAETFESFLFRRGLIICTKIRTDPDCVDYIEIPDNEEFTLSTRLREKDE